MMGEKILIFVLKYFVFLNLIATHCYNVLNESVCITGSIMENTCVIAPLEFKS